MTNLLREPLVHFLLIGAGLLALAALYSGEGDADRRRASESAGRQIYVEADALRQFVQAKTQISDPDLFSARWNDLDAAARAHWLELFVREEALVREARRLGLDQHDDLIRRRLVQQLEFVAIGQAQPDLEFGEKELEEIYRQRGEDHRIPAALSFSHVFVRVDDAGLEAARAEALSLLRDLDTEGVDAAGALGRGDRFLYNRNYVERTHEEIASHFGEEMLAALLELEPDARKWKGPFLSPHGFHLVLLTDSEPSRLPSADEIRGVLREDWLREQREAALDRAVAEIVSSFEVEVDPALDPFR